MSEIIEVPENIYSAADVEKEPNIDEYLRDINCNERVIKFLKKAKIRRGDVAHFEQFGEYRNDGKAIWTGSELVCLDSSYDDYGAVPKEFTLEEFDYNKDYFKNSIDHNSIVWINGADYKVLSKGIILDNYEGSKLYVYTIKNIRNNHKWYVVSVLNKTRFIENSLADGMFFADHEVNENAGFQVPDIQLTLYDNSLEEL